MDLILWRHAEAEDVAAVMARTAPALSAEAADLQRFLTARGLRQAVLMARWLDTKLVDNTRVLVSPASRCEQTVIPLSRKYKLCPELLPGSGPDDLLRLAQWPTHKRPVLVVAHQPALGQVVARLLGGTNAEIVFRKGAVWWLRSRDRHCGSQTVTMSVQSPDFL